MPNKSKEPFPSIIFHFGEGTYECGICGKTIPTHYHVKKRHSGFRRRVSSVPNMERHFNSCMKKAGKADD